MKWNRAEGVIESIEVANVTIFIINMEREEEIFDIKDICECGPRARKSISTFSHSQPFAESKLKHI